MNHAPQSSRRDRARTAIERLEPIEIARTVWHGTRGGFGRRDRRTIERYLATSDPPALHLGGGTRLLPGWLNTDLWPRPGAVRLNARRPLPFHSATFDFVYGEHMIEHLTYPAAADLLAEVHRVLRPGGVARFSTPDLDRLVRMCARRDELTDIERRYVAQIERLCLADVGVEITPTFVLNNNVRAWGHVFLYDERTFVELLESVGFTAIARRPLQDSPHPMLSGLANERRMAPGLVDFETMTFEARRT